MPNTEVGSAFVSVYPKLSGDWDKIGDQAGTSMGKSITTSTSKYSETAGRKLGKSIGSILSEAVNLVMDDLDEGIAKSDMLNQFPKAMENLGFEAGIAEQSIKDIMSHLQGLPTATDDLLPFVSSLASITHDLERSTAFGLAFNDMLVAANASTGDASRAMEMLSKMLASGEFNAQRWQSILEVMPGQLDQVAKEMLGTEASADDLGKALSNGSITLDDFVSEVIRMDKEGGEGFKSFEDQAHNSSEGIQTSIDNIHNKIRNGWVEIVEALDSKNIKGALEGIGWAAQTAMHGVAELIISFEQFGQNVETIARRIDVDAHSLLENLVSTVQGGVFGIGNEIGGLFSDIGSGFESFSHEMYDGVSSTVEGIASFLGIDLDQIEADITGTNRQIRAETAGDWAYISDTISSEMDEAVRSVSEGVAGIEGLFAGMQISLPSLPELNMTQTGSGDPMDWLKGSTASVKMWWGATGGYFDSATFIGVGEKGGELLLPESGGLMDPFADAVAERVEDNGGEYVVAWLSDNLPYIIEHFTPTVGQRDFDRMARRATA